MERHKCKVCLRSFSNGRALGGHMRSHMMNLSLPPKPEELPPPPPLLQPQPPPPPQSHEEAELASSSSEQEEGEEKENLSYGLRENPKRSIRLVDPEFPFTDNCGGSVILQDRESETESSQNQTRRRSKRARKPGSLNHHHRHYHHHHQISSSNVGPTESWTEPEPLSSISDTTTEEDVAVCLMLLSRDKWTKLQEPKEQEDEDEEEEEEDEEEDQTVDEDDDDDQSEEERIKFTKMNQKQSKGGNKYKCETCNKVFRSYQALGGHRASHKKIKLTSYSNRQFVQENSTTKNNNNNVVVVKNSSSSSPALMAPDKRKIHECPVCFRVFSSGQALGGHKRSHVTGLTATVVTPQPPRKNSSTIFGNSLIDLNLPAPVDEDDVSQIELSAVSDAEFVNPFRQ